MTDAPLRIATSGTHPSRPCESCGEPMLVRVNESGQPIAQCCGAFGCPRFLRQEPYRERVA